MKPLTTVPRVATATAAALLLLTGTAACQAADADSNPDAGGESAPSGGGQDDDSAGTEVGYLYYERYNDDTSTTVLRWDGTEAGKVEEVTTGTTGDRMYQTIDVSRYGEYLSWGDDGEENGQLLTYDIETGETQAVADMPAGIDSCDLPTWAPDGRPQLAVRGESPATMTILDVPSGSRSDEIPVNSTCYVQQASGDQADGTDLFYFNYDARDVEFSRYGEIVSTGVGPAVQSALGDETSGLTAISGDGSYVCVTAGGLDGGGRQHDCHAIVDVATDEVLKQTGDQPFQARWAYDSLVVRQDGAISYYPTTSAIGGEAETTVPEPAELQGAELFGVTQGHTVEE